MSADTGPERRSAALAAAESSAARQATSDALRAQHGPSPRLPTLADRGRALLATRRRQHDTDGIAIDAALGAAESHAAIRHHRLTQAATIANRLAALPDEDPPVYVIGRFVPLVEGWRFETCDELTWVWLEARERLERARNTDPTWGLWELRQATPTAQELP